MQNELGKWAVIDIETTGISQIDDSIIDIGFLQFEGTKLVKKYSSLVKYEGELSHFIQKLTGITNQMVAKAPRQEDIEPDLYDLCGHHLLAHNADFEKSFLDPIFKAGPFEEESEEIYVDSLYYLALLHPGRSQLNLESFIQEYQIADKEIHRGFEDSVDLLKVVLLATYNLQKNPLLRKFIISTASKYQFGKDFFLMRFLELDESEIFEIAEQIDFDLDLAMDKYRESKRKKIAENKAMPLDSYEFKGENIQKILRDQDNMSERLDGYRYREQQEKMSLRVGQALGNDVHALIQAPTGTGKTLGYLLPASFFSMHKHEQVLVATGTKALQSQIVEKDIPLLKKMMGKSDLKVARLVGSSNHFCELLFQNDQTEQGGLLGADASFEEKFTRLFYEIVFFVAGEEEKEVTGEDLPYVMGMKLPFFKSFSQDIRVDYRSCSSHRCPFSSQCSYIKGLRKAKEADVIVGNHALMFSWTNSFARPKYIIVDEAHRVEQEATSAFTLSAGIDDLLGIKKALDTQTGLGPLYYLLGQYLDEEQARETIKKVKEDALGLANMMGDHLLELPSMIEQIFKRGPRFTELYWNEMKMPTVGGGGTLEVALFNRLQSMHFLLSELVKLVLPHAAKFDIASLKTDQEIMAGTRFLNFVSSLEEVTKCMEVCLGGDEDYTRVLKYHENFGASIEATPINIGDKVHKSLLCDSSSVIFTSATLGNAQGDQGVNGVEWMTGYGQLDPERRFKSGLFLPASFDYGKNAKVFICDDTPSFKDHQFIEKVLSDIAPIIEELGGRSLLLFSSRVRFEKAREFLLKKFEGKIPLFVQGMGQRVVEEFKEASNGILLGMESFGEGIDIPGKKLQFLFVDKIPDLRMDQVIRERRDFYQRSFGNEFVDYFLASRARGLHQKLGRLLRKENDIGAAIIVDSRIRSWKGRTMKDFVKLLEPYQVERVGMEHAKKEVLDFLRDAT